MQISICIIIMLYTIMLANKHNQQDGALYIRMACTDTKL